MLTVERFEHLVIEINESGAVMWRAPLSGMERDPADHAVAVVVDPYAQIQRLERYTQIQVLKAPRDRAGDRLPASGV